MDLSVDGNSNYVATGTPDSASPVSNSTNGVDGSDLIAAMFNGLLVAVPALQVLLGNALALKGGTADLVTRLSRVIEADGALRKGSSFPGTPVGGQPFWRTDQALFYVYDAVAGQWVLGQDNPLYALLDGTRDFLGDIKIKTSVPGYRLKGTEASAHDVLIAESGGSLIVYDNTGTEGIPIWTARFTINLATGVVTTTNTLSIVGNFDLSGTMNSGTVPLARLGAPIPQTSMANGSIGAANLKTAIGASSVNVPNGTFVDADYTMNDYAFAPLVTIFGGGAANSVLFSQVGADPADSVARFHVKWDNSSGSGLDSTGLVRWRYITASDRPEVWILKDPATGLIVASWWSDDPIPGGGQPLAIAGKTAQRLTASELSRLAVPAKIVTQAEDFIRQNNLNPANVVQRALRLMTGDDAPASWLLNNCKLDAQGHLADLTAQDKLARSPKP